jgi:6-phosphofructokinase 1
MSSPKGGELAVACLGDCRVPSPLLARHRDFTEDGEAVLVATTRAELATEAENGEALAFEGAGARRQLFFDPARIACGIVSCGGLCPGINNVIRGLVLTLRFAYGVERVFGFRYGYSGIAGCDEAGDPLPLTPEVVEPIHRWGGSILGSSRGPQDVRRMVDRLQELGISILFAIGGDGTLRGAGAIAEEATKRGLQLAVIGVPKTIDNDIAWIDRTFGFASAVEAARATLDGAHAEAAGALHGISLVKLMGRHSGFIAAHASLATSDVNFCLVPEVPFTLEAFLRALEERLRDRRHALVVVAEGAGQDLFDTKDAERDASGNRKLQDIGRLLKDAITRHFDGRLGIGLKYIDPSYGIRSVPANAIDAEFCLALAQHAVHAGLAGRTNLVIGHWHGHFTHVPIPLAVASRKTLDPRGNTWQSILEATGQPAEMV